MIQISAATKKVIKKELKCLEKEKRFFEVEPDYQALSMCFFNSEIAGVLKTGYVEIKRIMMRFYKNVQALEQYRGKEEDFLRHILGIWLQKGILASETKIAELRKEIRNTYSFQLEIFTEGQVVSLEPLKKDLKNILEMFDTLNFYLESVYGEVNHTKAFLVEALLALPSSRSVLFRSGVTQEESQRDQSYLDDLIRFSCYFSPQARIENVVKISKELGIEYSWYHPKPERPEIDDFDRDLIKELWEEINEPCLQNFYKILKETRLRRGRIFRLEKTGTGLFELFCRESPLDKETETLIKPVKLDPIGFDKMGGYQNKKDFFLRLLKHIKEKNEIVDELNIVLLSGKPGLGKSMSVVAFLNLLPSNARGIFLACENFYKELDYLRELAKMHPDLYLVGIAEDLDTVAQNRDMVINP
ncbi:hypothetical protein MYX07_04665, partial [Patescibacteria group bacterium AH-259-L07]|nr:hypothetical protein [Patescibacteria group bacterium AH-259-L07]